MAYRTSAQRPEEEPKPKAPVERYVVSRYGVWPALAIMLGVGALAFWMVWIVRAKSTIDCVRASVGAVPRCTVSVHAVSARDVAPFDLREGSLTIAKRMEDDAEITVLSTPNGDVRAAVNESFAEETVADARRFLATPNELHWSASRANDLATTAAALAGVLFLGITASIMRRTQIAIDPDARVLRVGKVPYPLDGITTANVEAIDESVFFRLVLHVKKEDAIPIAEGREKEARAAAAAINHVLRKRRD